MATARLLLLNYRPLDCVLSSSSSYVKTVTCVMNVGSNGQKIPIFGDSERKSTVVVKASAAKSENVNVKEPRVGRGVDLGSLDRDVSNVTLEVLKRILKRRGSKLQLQRFIERVIIDCRFFTLLAVAGSLLGSVLCITEGCFLVLEAYFHNFHGLSLSSDGHILHLLIEAIDTFLLGTSMLIFGTGVYTMFVGSRTLNQNAPFHPGSYPFGLFHLKKLPTWVEMGSSVSEAKSKIGHAIVMMLHVGMLEKFKNIPLVSCLDLACFAASLFVSSASMFVLSRLSTAMTTV